MNRGHIYVKNLDQEVSFENEETLLEVLLKHKIEIDNSCEGMGTCGTCRVYIQSNIDLLPPRNEIESERAADLLFKDNERLCCQLRPIDKTEIIIPITTEQI